MTVDLIMEDVRWKTLSLIQIANAAFKETLSEEELSEKSFMLGGYFKKAEKKAEKAALYYSNMFGQLPHFLKTHDF